MDYKADHQLILIAELQVKPELRREFLDYTAENLPLSRQAEGNVVFDILIDHADPDTVRFYEVWESKEAQQAYIAWRVERGDLGVLQSFLDSPPKFIALKRMRG